MSEKNSIDSFTIIDQIVNSPTLAEAKQAYREAMGGSHAEDIKKSCWTLLFAEEWWHIRELIWGNYEVERIR